MDPPASAGDAPANGSRSASSASNNNNNNNNSNNNNNNNHSFHASHAAALGLLDPSALFGEPLTEFRQMTNHILTTVLDCLSTIVFD